LYCVGVVGGVLEEAVVGVEDFPGDEEEELPGRAAVVEAFLAVEGHVQAVLGQGLLRRAKHLVECVLQKQVAADLKPGTN